ncbi:MAG: MurT ligase domain-containing protein [Gaiellales bacterium]
MSARVRAAGGLARFAGTLARGTGRGGGTTMPGHVFLRIAPNGLARLAADLRDGVIAVSATNGKTTTSAMLSHILAPDHVVCRNAAGANLLSGIASSLVDRPRGADIGVLEVDEAALSAVVAQTTPRALVLGNLFRDQLDRHGELELVADRWRAMVAGLPSDTQLVLGADDPVIDALGDGRANVLRFGIDDPGAGLALRDEAADSTFCVRCGAAYVYDVTYLGHLGAFRCPQGDHARGTLDVVARDVRPQGLQGTVFRVDAPDGSCEVTLPLPGLYNVENALGAIAAAHAIGTPTATAAARLASFVAAFGRFERIPIEGREAVLILFKNPAGANEALRAISADVAGAEVVLALNDGIADGRDVSWIWDVDFEGMLDGAIGVTCAGTRAADLAVRLRYADVPIDLINRVTDPETAFDAAVHAVPSGGRVYILATYTAMLDLHRALAARGLTEPFWEGSR